MNHSDEGKYEGLGLSVAVYALAMICGLALFAMPVVWANGPRIYDNPGVSALRMPGGPAYAHRQEFPLANLQSPDIVNPAMLAELNASSKKRKPQREARPARRSYAQADQTDATAEPRRARRPFFFFSLFGG